jgi:FkbM family methyltransferase
MAMRKSNTLNVLGEVISNPKQFAREWKQTQQDLAKTKYELAQSREHLVENRRRLAEADCCVGDLIEQVVTGLYQELLGRQPDADGLQRWVKVAQSDGVKKVCAGIIASDEFKRRSSPWPLSVFRGYEDRELDILSEFANANAAPQPGFVVDFMGGRTRANSLWSAARKLDGRVIPPPVPSDGFHAEAVEWIGVLKSVRSAREQFVAMELGAGLGPWIVAGGIGARSRGIKDIRLYAVEADPTHYRLLCQNLDDNGFLHTNHVLLNAAVGVVGGKAYWPVVADPREDWGSRPLETAHQSDGKKDYLGRSFENFIEVEIVPIHDLIVRENRWDLVHLDVQGHEYEICEAALPELNARVHWLVVGTHSRILDGQMLRLLFSVDWILENEKPTKFRFGPMAASLEAMTICDGVQAWRNPRLD